MTGSSSALLPVSHTAAARRRRPRCAEDLRGATRGDVDTGPGGERSAAGHFHPLVPLALAMRDAGEEVRVASAPSVCEQARSIGLAAVPVGTEVEQFDTLRSRAAVGGRPARTPHRLHDARQGPEHPHLGLTGRARRARRRAGQPRHPRPTCAAVISHAGSGTTLAVLAHGLPQRLIPQGTDQFVNADRCVQSGAGHACYPARWPRRRSRRSVSPSWPSAWPRRRVPTTVQVGVSRGGPSAVARHLWLSTTGTARCIRPNGRADAQARPTPAGRGSRVPVTATTSSGGLRRSGRSRRSRRAFRHRPTTATAP